MDWKDFVEGARWEAEQQELRIAKGENLPHLAFHGILFRDIAFFVVFMGTMLALWYWEFLTTGERLDW